MIGVAVGLGNVWRFPYMMGQNGGSAFLVVYLVFVLVFAIPAITAEWSLGRYTRHGPIGAMAIAFGPFGRWIGYLLVLTVLIANSRLKLLSPRFGLFGLVPRFVQLDDPPQGFGQPGLALVGNTGFSLLHALIAFQQQRLRLVELFLTGQCGA